jgi:potassium-transporting ATPase KdpC subunit
MKTLIISFKAFLFFTVITGIIYPLLITGVAQIFFPWKANGSLILSGNKIRGSELIGQQFDSSIYFSSRPSAISYNSLPSGGSNYGLTNRKLKELVEKRKGNFGNINRISDHGLIPSEMLFSSGSGLDPHISRKAAMLQVGRVAAGRDFDKRQYRELLECVNRLTEPPQFLFLGEERINVLLLNLATDTIK